MDIISKLRNGLIVSCQAKPGSPLRDPQVLSAMAQAAEIGGAAGIRANGVEDVSAICAKVKIPIIGIYKLIIPEYDVFITPTLESARQVVNAGASILAMDATNRERPDSLSIPEAIRLYKGELGVPVMADISTLEEGLAAAEAGADIIATTLSGYTAYSTQRETPDFAIISRLAARIQTPVVAEGRIVSPEDARRALESGAYAVVVGTAITAIDWVTQRYAAALSSYQGK